MSTRIPPPRTVQVPWLSIVTRADPDWARDHRMQPELEPDNLPSERAAVKRDWQNSGPYE